MSFRFASISVLALGIAVACSGGPKGDDDDDAGSSGESGASHGGTSGGTLSTAGSGGASATGGANSKGGSGGSARGGSTAAGGTTTGGQGGATSAGGGGKSGGGTSTGGDGANGGTGNLTSGGTGGAASGTGGGSSGSSGTTSFPPTCQYGCTTTADCPAPSFYQCTDGLCVYEGCASDAQCETELPGTVCRPFPYYGYSTCVPTCATAADCSLDVAPYDTDNYTCDRGGCVHHGCNNDAECDAYVAGYVCYDAPGTYPSCSIACTVPADCTQSAAQPAYANPDHYACTDGKCIFSGCESDAECAVDGVTQKYVCRPFQVKG